MPGERDAENLRVALMSYDDRELRIRKFYLEEQSTIIRCTCFQSGEPVLQALRQERCFDVLVLSSQLEDMDSLTFLEKLNRLPSHPAAPVAGRRLGRRHHRRPPAAGQPLLRRRA